MKILLIGDEFIPYGQTDGKTDMTKPLVTFCDLENDFKKICGSINSPRPLLRHCTSPLIFHFLNVKLHQTAKIFANCDINKTADMSKPRRLWCRDTAFYHLPVTAKHTFYRVS